MSEEKENQDKFLKSLIGVKPIKKSNKNYRKIKHFKISDITPVLANKNNQTIETVKKTKKDFKMQSQKIETSSLNKKLKKGKIAIDKKVDLHGYTVDQAKLLFNKTIDRCFDSNKRCILFITGKGMSSNKGDKLYYGKIRASLFRWINEKENVSKILSVNNAGIQYGGDGAIFVYLRKKKY